MMSEVVQGVKRKQSQVSWIDLKSADPETKLVAVKFPSSVVRLVLVTNETLSAEQERALSAMGFYRTPSDLLVRDDLKFTLPVIQSAFPGAVPVQVPMNKVTRIMRDGPAAGGADAPGERASAVSIKNAVMTAKPLGINHHGQTVYQGEDGRFVKDGDGHVVREGGGVAAALFLYARTAEDLALCAEGFVGEIAGGKVMRAEDLKRFTSVVMELPEADVTTSPRLREAQEAIEAALVRYMQKHAGQELDRGAFLLAQKLEEGQPAFTARTSDSVTLQQYSTPITMSVAVQRIVGDAGGLDVLDPTIGNGSLVFSMANSNIVGCDLDKARLGNVARARPDATLAAGDATTLDLRELNDNKPYDVILANPPFGGLNCVFSSNAPGVLCIAHHAPFIN